MDKKRAIRLEKNLSLVLRHKPQVAGVELDEAGWTKVEALLSGLRTNGTSLEKSELLWIVENSKKRRFSLSDDGLRIRANQGHSVAVELGYETAEPPALLYHGTPERFVSSIREQGILRGSRHHVHLSDQIDTAKTVGARRGKAVVLAVDAQVMHESGHMFFRSDNDVWLTKHVPPTFIKERLAFGE